MNHVGAAQCHTAKLQGSKEVNHTGEELVSKYVKHQGITQCQIKRKKGFTELRG